jgi:transposase
VIAEALGVTAGAVSQWLKRARAKGAAALYKRKVPGAKPRLSTEQLARLPELLTRGAEAYGFRGDIWTRNRVAEIIWHEFGVRSTPTHVGRICGTVVGPCRSRSSPPTPAGFQPG